MKNGGGPVRRVCGVNFFQAGICLDSTIFSLTEYILVT